MIDSTNEGRDTAALSDEQLEKVQGGQGISTQVTLKNSLKPKLQSTTGGSIAQGDTLDNTQTEDGLP